jgi:hypothetical protein
LRERVAGQAARCGEAAGRKEAAGFHARG